MAAPAVVGIWLIPVFNGDQKPAMFKFVYIVRGVHEQSDNTGSSTHRFPTEVAVGCRLHFVNDVIIVWTVGGVEADAAPSVLLPLTWQASFVRAPDVTPPTTAVIWEYM